MTELRKNTTMDQTLLSCKNMFSTSASSLQSFEAEFCLEKLNNLRSSTLFRPPLIVGVVEEEVVEEEEEVEEEVETIREC